MAKIFQMLANALYDAFSSLSMKQDMFVQVALSSRPWENL